MEAYDFIKITRKFKKCPNCGSSWKDTKLNVELENDIVTISCECGFLKRVNKDNKEIK
jgi:RNase P subunit RPR2